jgi:deoxyribodipyrimidine photo-lyase
VPRFNLKEEKRQRLNPLFFETKNLSVYKETRNGMVGEAYSSKFSAWLAMGCISPRTIYKEIRAYERKMGPMILRIG